MSWIRVAKTLFIIVQVTHRIWANDSPRENEGELHQERFYEQLERTLTHATLTGRFTISGKESAEPISETYTIERVTKLERGDFWLFQVRIEYGNKDLTIPLALEVKWAGDTPMITLTKFPIPRLGTFSARVIIYDDMYAGTWRHGDVNGHMLGNIVREKKAESNNKE